MMVTYHGARQMCTTWNYLVKMQNWTHLVHRINYCFSKYCGHFAHMEVLTNNIKDRPMTNSYSLEITSRLLCRSEVTTLLVFLTITISLTERGLPDLLSSSPVTKSLVPVKCDISATFYCLFRLAYEFPSLCRRHSRSYTKFNYTSLLHLVFWRHLFWDFFLQILQFKMTSKFLIMTYDVETWQATCVCNVLVLYEILGNYNTFW